MEVPTRLRVLAEGVKLALLFALRSQLALQTPALLLLLLVSPLLLLLLLVLIPLVLLSTVDFLLFAFLLGIFDLLGILGLLCFVFHVLLHLLALLLFLLLFGLFCSLHLCGLDLPFEDFCCEGVDNIGVVDACGDVVPEFFRVALSIEIGIEEDSKVPE
jgi:hypothetical protein